MRPRSLVVSLLLATTTAPAAAQTFEAVPDTGRLTVGDPVSIRLVLRQYEGDALLEQVPHAEVRLDNGIRLLSTDSMRPIANRRLEARVRLAFYRPGPQTIPPFAIDFRRGAVILHGTMRTEPVAIEIAPVLEAGNGQRLRDIKESLTPPGPDPRLAAVGAALVAAAWLWRRRRGRSRPPAPALILVPSARPETPDAYAAALARLREIESEGWAARGDVARHYEAVADALRGYLAEAERLPARQRTTRELLWTLPRHLEAPGLRGSCEAVFDEADLVKFARRRPDAGTGEAFLARARALLTGWREAARTGEAADAVR
jgi:MYXO-CTERM domain-containing protein